MQRFPKLKYIFFDLEGVLINIQNAEQISFDEFYSKLKEFVNHFFTHGIVIGIISASEDNSVIDFFSKIPNLVYIKSTIDKVSSMEHFLKFNKDSFEELFYICINILEIHLIFIIVIIFLYIQKRQKAKFKSAPSNARREVKKISNIKLNACGYKEIFSSIHKIFLG